MMINNKNLVTANIVLFLMLAFVCTNPVIAQSYSIQNLVTESKTIQDSITTLQLHLDDLQNRFGQLNSDIYRLKTELRAVENPIKRIKLERALKESSKYAEQIKLINLRIEDLDKKLKSNYKEIINVLNEKINSEINNFNSTDESSLKTTIIEKVNELEDKKQQYYKLLNEKIPVIIKDKTIEITKKDNLSSINLKIYLLKDKLAFLEEEKKYLLQKKKEFNADLSIYTEMSNFMSDLRRSLDEEQEFYDPDRAEKITLKIKEIKNKLSSINKRLSAIRENKIYYTRKLNKFNKYKKSLLLR